MPEKSRFLRLLDLSLRSSTLPSKLIASFIKRLARIIVSYGAGFTPQDIMFVVSFITNLIKRHPRCLKLVSRKPKEGKPSTVENDSFREDEADPMKTKASHSSLWELESIMKEHIDSKVRNYAKVLKTDFMKKGAFFKSEELVAVDPLDIL